MDKNMDHTSRPIGIGILGCGYWGVNYVRTFQEMAGARVVAVCDSREERLQEVMPRFPGVFFTTDLGEMLSQDGLDAVVVCTEATKHYEVAFWCLQAGKHLLIEKPLATKVSDAEELTLFAEQN